MKKRLSTIFFMPVLTFAILACTASNVAAQTVVSKASKLQWDDTNEAGSVTHSRVYAQRTPDVVPDGVSFVAEIPAPAMEWTIDSDVGSWWVVVTFTNDDGTTVVESEPSNEVHYVVIGPPTNVEVVR